MNQFDQQGFLILENQYSDHEITELEDILNRTGAFNYSSSTIQNLLTVDFVANFIRADKFTSMLPPSYKDDLIPIKAFILDKSKAFNWMIPWHQDLKIAVRDTLPVENYSNWTTEAGIPHVEPPLPVLEGLLTVRIHLDDCRKENGAMEVVPGSHKSGKLDKKRVAELAETNTEVCCEVNKGGVMVFKPLLLHRSPLSEHVASRRILQIELGLKNSLHPKLEWHI